MRPDSFPPLGDDCGSRRSRLRLGVGRGDSQHPRNQWRGELGYLAAISPAVHRLALETTDRHAAAIAAAIADTAEVAPEIARLQGMALAGVFQVIISEAGNRTRQGQSQAKIADELYPIIGRTVDELDRWFQASEPSSRAKADGRRQRR